MPIPMHLLRVIEVFKKHEDVIDSSKQSLASNNVLVVLRESLAQAGFKVEKGYKIEDKIKVAVLFGRDGKLEKSFHADALHEDNKTVIEVEARRAVVNFQFLKDLFEACMMHNVEYSVIAVRRVYRRKADFEIVNTYFDTLYATGRLKLPLKGILIVGY
jgi:hypothetical protein